MASTRMQDYLRGQADLQPHRKPKDGREPDPIRLTPGQYAELTAELGAEPRELTTSLGRQRVERIECHTQATGDNVILCPREDLFSEVERDTGVELVSSANAVTSIPNNVACVEVVSVGELVTNVAPGDLVFLDFFSVKQGYVLSSRELYIAGADAFQARYSPVTQEILPLDNFVITKRDHDRFKVALNGTDRLHVPAYKFTDGVVGGKTSVGSEAAHVIYQVVVSVGRLTNRPRPGVMTKAERAFLAAVAEYGLGPGVGECQDAWAAVADERDCGRTADIQPGELVVFTKEIGTPIRVRGEFCYIVPYDNVLATINDAAVLADARARDAAAPRIQVA